jgi:hypothetical protein
LKKFEVRVRKAGERDRILRGALSQQEEEEEEEKKDDKVTISICYVCRCIAVGGSSCVVELNKLSHIPTRRG